MNSALVISLFGSKFQLIVPWTRFRFLNCCILFLYGEYCISKNEYGDVAAKLVLRASMIGQVS